MKLKLRMNAQTRNYFNKSEMRSDVEEITLILKRKRGAEYKLGKNIQYINVITLFHL